MNRASRDGESMFYGSINPLGPIWELNPSVGDKMVISRWHVVNDLHLNNVGFTPTVFERLSSTRKPQIFIGDERDENHPDNIQVYNFLADKFSQPIGNNIDTYRLTIAIAENLINGLDGLVYPTIALTANFDNVALFPKVVDDQLKLEAVSYDEIVLVDSHDINYRLKGIDYSNTFSSDGTICWKGRAGLVLHATKEWRDKYYFTVEH